ncbi:MAG: DEAD/DEAH box helicase family protein [Firmicutes bacterium]|nr:DEAD/DEAH box helicase family protein [Bacillota bacterium]
MKLRFKHQKFQADAAKAVCDVFAGQPRMERTYLVDQGTSTQGEQTVLRFDGTTDQGQEQLDMGVGYHNSKVLLSADQVLENLRRVQRQNQIEPSKSLEGEYNLTIEMETGVGKTYTYIKTMYELNKHYGWSKFIVVVPSVAIREGVYKSFQITQDHFAEDYNKKIRFFIYDSSKLNQIDQFATDSGINVMIINSQAFNSRGRDARRIYMKLDSFRSRRPIDVLAATNPILIIDEPQSVEGKATKERLKEFNPLITLRYSATHRKDSIYNMVYRLDALEAYNKRLVKKIAVKGISVLGTTATEGYLYLEKINRSDVRLPTASLEFEVKGTQRIRRVTRVVREGSNLFELSGELGQYHGYTVLSINGSTNTVEFTNGLTIAVGDVVGAVNEDHLRRIQIRETILSHLERERKLFYKGIKVLSLFFIDEVAKYRQYGEDGEEVAGEYARIFEEEYQRIRDEWQRDFGDDAYHRYLEGIDVTKTHAGYFSIDKRSNRMQDSKIHNKREGTSDDVDAYDLIMKDKERLLSFEEPVRFIFSHSALREGWDNPNVFQICTLKQSGSDVRKRQEVGRGLRLAVNKNGDRQDSNVLGGDVHDVNVLTVIANESYDRFAKQLQSEIAEVVSDRPVMVTEGLFVDKVIVDDYGENELVIDEATAREIVYELTVNRYLDKNKALTEKYYDEVKSGSLRVTEDLQNYKKAIVSILSTIYDPRVLMPEDARGNNVELRVDQEKLEKKEFKELWKRINAKSAYIVEFDHEELIKKAIRALDRELRVSEIFITVEQGALEQIESKEALERGEAFSKAKSSYDRVQAVVNTGVTYDLIGDVVAGTGLTRSDARAILQGISKATFNQFQRNPEEFILKATNIINEQKASVVIEHITYNKLGESYSVDLFTDPTLKGRLGVNAMRTEKHLYDHLLYDSKGEMQLAQNLEAWSDVAIYIKLPRGFYINTPVGKYSPDWALAFHDEKVKHIYFVAETKGDLSSLELRKVEDLKIRCAQEHFRAISSGSVRYEVVESYDTLLNVVMRSPR